MLGSSAGLEDPKTGGVKYKILQPFLGPIFGPFLPALQGKEVIFRVVVPNKAGRKALKKGDFLKKSPAKVSNKIFLKNFFSKKKKKKKKI